MFFPTDAEKIISVVNKMNDKNSAGHDNIPMNIMRSSIRHVAGVLSAMVNGSFRTGYFPDQ